MKQQVNAPSRDSPNFRLTVGMWALWVLQDTTRMVNLNQWWLRKSMLKLINIFGLGPGWGSPILPMSPQRSRAAMTCCSTAFWANVRRCTFYAAEDLPEKTEQLHSLRWRLWLHAFGCRQLTHSLMTPKGQKIDWDQIGNEPQVEWFSTVTDNSWKCSLWLSAMTCSTGASVERHPFFRCVEEKN